MKYLKTYEANTNSDLISSFFEKFEEYKSERERSFSEIEDRMKMYLFPEIFENEFQILYFLYDSHSYFTRWRTPHKIETDYIKRQVKKHVRELIIKKFKDDPNTYEELKSFFDKRPDWSKKGSFQNIREAIVKNVVFNFHSAFKKAPDYITQANIYNL